MKRRVAIRSATTVALMILGVSLSLAQSSQSHEHWRAVSAASSTAATPPWFIDTIDGDETIDVGQYVSVAIDPRNDRPYISYYDATNGDLRVAKHVESGGNCGPGDSWSCETVDSAGDVGKFSSIAIYTGTYPFTWKVGVSYYDADAYALKYAQYTWSQPLLAHKWITYTIHSGSMVNKYGLYTSLKFDPTGTPHISYHRSAPPSPSNDALAYAHRVGSGGNCGPGSDWECGVVDSGSGVGRYTSLSLYGSGSPEIAYYDSGNDRLKRAIHCGGSGAGCNPDNDEWICNVIDTAGGKYTSADRDSKGHRLHIAYYDEINGELESAQYWGSTGNCGPGDSWWCSRIDTIGTSPDAMGISLTIEDQYDFPLYAYQDIPGDPNTAALKVAGYNELGIIDPGGNCTDEAKFVSVDASPSGLIVIAYYESDICSSTGRLKVAHYPFHEIFLPLLLRDD
jgi:hypothetical protein